MLDSIRCGLHSIYKFKEPRTLLTSGGLGTMGYGLGACIGAKIGRKDKTVC